MELHFVCFSPHVNESTIYSKENLSEDCKAGKFNCFILPQNDIMLKQMGKECVCECRYASV